jgi:hypothetical protein
MRWTGLLLAVACTHTQPAPAPLGVPPENAAGPASLPDAEDGGAADGGTDAGAPRADLASPSTEVRPDLIPQTFASRPDKP